MISCPHFGQVVVSAAWTFCQSIFFREGMGKFSVALLEQGKDFFVLEAERIATPFS